MTLSSQSKVCKVLMVDDETLFLELMETILADLKLEVVRASNAKEAIELVEAHSPDLIITDTNMPLGSGIDLIRSVRERNNLTPIIIFFDGSHFDPQLKPGDILN
ncbi:MAG: response regulator, partial [Bdellovibrionales bacterium]|nr:response regulator [Bdellovibrionales bacterium]